jgi:2-amino-4-hydroxy-6-hydroxymethyldihydropteridine diphosphokinase
MTNRVFVSLGSNVDKEKNLHAAIKLLQEIGRLLAASSVYETAPIETTGEGSPVQEDRPLFWNAAVLMETTLDPAGFRRDVLEQVERQLDRRRTADRNAPRTIDADLTLFNDDVFKLDAKHPIPDPDLLRFAHVAVPIAELAPELNHPQSGVTLGQIAERLLQEAAEENRPLPFKRPDILLDIRGGS